MISVFSYVFINPALERFFQLHDTNGVASLHVIPGFLGAVVGAVAMAIEAPKYPTFFVHGVYQVGYQFEALLITIFISIASGGFAGFALKYVWPEKAFVDSTNWKETGESEEDEKDDNEVQEDLKPHQN